MNRPIAVSGAAKAAGLARLHPFSSGATAAQAHLRIMETTDIHMHVWPYDYYSDTPVDTVGLARTTAHINAIRAEATNSLLLDNGDFLQGNPMGDFIAYERGLKEGDVHPVIRALNTIGFEASTVGNHEFNYGLDFLHKALAGAEFPIVSANLVRRLGADPTRDDTLLPPYVILHRRLIGGDGRAMPVRIGVIGFVPPQITQWDRDHLDGKIDARDIVAAARAWVPQIREAGADLIVALAHSGIGPTAHAAGMENAAVPLAALDGIDAVLTGHQHLIFPSPTFAGLPGVDAAKGTLHGKPAVMAGCWGNRLGVIDLLLQRDAGVWRVLCSEVSTRPIFHRDGDRRVTPTVKSVRRVLASVAGEHRATLAYIRRAVGRTTVALNSYFATVAADRSVQLVNRAQMWYVASMLRGSDLARLPLLSAAAPFKAGGRGGPDYFTDVPAGDVAIRHVADLYLYPNIVRAVKVTGRQLKDWLERSAGLFNRITPGQPDQPLLNHEFPAYNFDVVEGVTYRIDLSQASRFDVRTGALADPRASRIIALEFDGRPIEPDAEFVVATNNYRAAGGGNFCGATPENVVFEGPDTNRDAIVRYLMRDEAATPAHPGAWRFAPLPRTSVLFESSPKAVAHLGEVPQLDIAAVGHAPDGFMRFRINL